MTVSPIRLGQNTAIFMAGGRSPRRRALVPSCRGQIRCGSREFLFETLIPNSSGKKPGQDVVHDIPPRRELEPDSERSKRGRP